jgi:hypothetical protein
MELHNSIKMSKDFEQIRYAHDVFLTKIQSQALMHHKIVTLLRHKLIKEQNDTKKEKNAKILIKILYLSDPTAFYILNLRV